MTNRIAVLSAHEGSISWVRMIEYLKRNKSFSITQISSFDDIQYRASKNFFSRILLRYKTFIEFPIRILLKRKLLIRNFDKIVIITSPFFLPFICALFIKGPLLIVLNNDIYPEALIIKKIIKRDSFFDRLIKRMHAYTFKRVHENVFISEEHYKIASSYYGFQGPYNIIYTPSHIVDGKKLHSENLQGQQFLVVLYSGTLGLLHDTSTFISFVSKFTLPPNYKFIFRTSGAAKSIFEKKVYENCASLIRDGILEIGDSMKVEEWETMMNSAQVGLVFQDVGAGSVIFPSKVSSMLVSGQAILGFMDEDSYLGKMILSNNLGWVIPQNDFEKFQVVLKELSDINILAGKRANAYTFGINNFSIAKIADKWGQILKNQIDS